MRKLFATIILSTFLLYLGNIGQYIPAFLVPQAHAATTTWDFNLTSDYTYSSSTGFSISGSLLQLEQNTLAHTGVISNATTYNGAYDIVVEGIYAYMTNFDGDRVTILNISNPAAPTFVSEIINNAGTIRLDGPTGLVKDGDFLYIASNVSDALQIINVTNPAAPVAAGQVVDATNLNGARGIAKSGNFVFITADVRDAVRVINVTNPAAPVAAGILRDNTNLNGARDIKIVGTGAYVTAFDGDRLTVLNITNPATPTLLGSVTNATTLNGAHDLTISGNYAYVTANLNNSFAVINITTPATPTITTSIAGGNYSLATARDILADGNKLFIASIGNDAINIANISNPAAPTYVSKIIHNAANPLLDGASGLFKVGNIVYAASSISDALEILRFNYDTSSPFVSPATAFNYGTDDISSIIETLGAGNEGTISYQISKNGGTTWYYWNGTAWTTTTLGVANSTSMSTINSNLSSFNALTGGTGVFSFKAFFTSNGVQKGELDSLTVNTIPAPTPGGVGTGMTLWLKANQGTSTTTDGAGLATWNDQGLLGLNATAVVNPIYRNNATDNLNFYPVVDFDGTTQYMQNLANGTYSDSYFMVIIPDNTVDGTLTGNIPFAFDCLSGTISSGTCGLSFAGLTLGAFTLAIPDEVITHAIGASTGWRSAQTGFASYAAGKPMLLMANENAAGNGTEVYEKGVQIDNTTRNTYQAISTADYSLGRSLDAANPFWYNGKIAEVINFNSRISNTDRNKIESYLAYKYGMILNNGTQNYIASDGTTLMWSSSLASGYQNNIFGIGRDDTQELGQVQAKSINNDAVVTLQALSEGSNMSPSFVDISDKEFFSVSDNAGSNTWTATNSPSGYSRLTREWRIQEIGDIGTIQLDFDVGDSDFDIPALSSGSGYYFLYDTNNNNNLTDDTPSLMTNVSGNIWRISGVNLGHLREFTIATLASSNNIPTDISLSPSSINENVATGSTIGVFSTTDADVSDTHTYSLVGGSGATNNSSFSISGSTLKILEIPDYEIQKTYSIRVETNDGNGGLYQEIFSITINDIGEAISSIIDFETPGKYSVTSGNWSRSLTGAFENQYSLVSNNGGSANSQSCFEVNHTFTATGGIDFYYKVSSEATDILHFYIDNVEQGTGWSGTVPWTQYVSPDISAGTHTYKWCYIKDGANNVGTDNANIDYITFPNRGGDIIAPTISGANYASGVLLPGGVHSISLGYSDAQSGINTGSTIFELYKWNGSSWGTNIAGSAITQNSVTTTGALYSTNNLIFGKYLYTFSVSDIAGNTSTYNSVFYIDSPEIIISSGSINIGNLSSLSPTFSDTVSITVLTVGAPFQVIMNRTSPLQYGGTGSTIASWNGSLGYGYEISPFAGSIFPITSNEILSTQGASINTNGNKNTYIYNIKIGALVDLLQDAGDYTGTLSFDVDFDY